MEENPFINYLQKSKDLTGPTIFINLLDNKLAGEKEISERFVELLKNHLSDGIKYKYLNLNKSTDI